jgi:hypothetical protein
MGLRSNIRIPGRKRPRIRIRNTDPTFARPGILLYTVQALFHFCIQSCSLNTMDPHYFGKLNLDPHKSEKLDPDPD